MAFNAQVDIVIQVPVACQGVNTKFNRRDHRYAARCIESGAQCARPITVFFGKSLNAQDNTAFDQSVLLLQNPIARTGNQMGIDALKLPYQVEPKRTVDHTGTQMLKTTAAGHIFQFAKDALF
ncbi:MAG: hypothetical protein B7X10_03895, partial [Burkholderiales bacterium 21-58-4]